jgi:hypothetical protein
LPCGMPVPLLPSLVVPLVGAPGDPRPPGGSGPAGCHGCHVVLLPSRPPGGSALMPVPRPPGGSAGDCHVGDGPSPGGPLMPVPLVGAPGDPRPVVPRGFGFDFM